MFRPGWRQDLSAPPSAASLADPRLTASPSPELNRARRAVIEVASVCSGADLREFQRLPRLLRGADQRWVEPPVLPVTIGGGHDAWPPGRVLPRRGRITITSHPPLHPDPALEPREAARDLAARAYAAVVSALPEAAAR